MVYFPFDPKNNNTYEYRQVSQKQMLSVVWKYSSLFDEKTILSFTKWCTHKKLDFLKVAPKRKQVNDERLSTTTLFVVKKQFIGKDH